MASTIHDVAELAGTSIATVSRALNEPAKVKPSTRDRVLTAVETLSFRPNLLGRQLRGVRTQLIGVVLPDVFNPVFGECMQGIEESAAASGYRVMLMTTRYDASREAHAIGTLLSQRVDGLILTVAEATSHPLLDELARSGVPYQLVYNHNPSHPCVSVDNRGAARDGVRLLVAHGHRKVLMLTGSLTASDRAMQRYQGYCDALSEAGLPAEQPLQIDFNERSVPPHILQHLTDERSRPTALFCGNDLLALVVMRALREVGVRVPADISIVGFDGLAIGELLTPPLATVCQPNRAIGTAAWRHLLVTLEGGPTASSILPHRIRADGTVAPLIPNPPSEYLP